MPLDLGCWQLGSEVGNEVILEIDPHVGFAYLYSGGAMVSSVWLFNLDGPPPDAADADALPDMPREFLTPGARAPKSLDDIEVTFEISQRWIISWGHTRAVLKPGATPGYSSAVTSFTPFARPIEDLKL